MSEGSIALIYAKEWCEWLNHGLYVVDELMTNLLERNKETSRYWKRDWISLLSDMGVYWFVEDIRASSVARQIVRDWASNELPHYAEPAICPLQTV